MYGELIIKSFSFYFKILQYNFYDCKIKKSIVLIFSNRNNLVYFDLMTF